MEDKIKELGLLLGKANKLVGEINPAAFTKQEFEAGKWYTARDYRSPLMINIMSVEHNCFIAFGFNRDGCWSSKSMWFDNNIDGALKSLSPATPQEVEEALIKEAEKKYSIIKNGTRFTLEGAYRDCYIMLSVYSKENWAYNSKDDTLSLMGFPIYKQGKWAEIVKKEALTFGGNPVTIDGNKITCKGVTGTYEQLKRIYDEFVNPDNLRFGTAKLEQYVRNGIVFGFDHANGLLGIEKIKIGCLWGTIDEIKAILEAVEEHKFTV